MFDDYKIEILIITIFFFIASGLYVFNKFSSKKRIEALKKMAYKLGFHFIEESQENILSTLSIFKLFNLGYHQNVFNMMYGTYNGKKWFVFDFRFSVNAGNHEHISYHSAAFTKDNSTHLPPFSLGPESFIKKIATAFNSQDINFSSNPQFSEKYLLEGEDESLIRQVFTTEVLRFFEQKENGLNLEANGTNFIYFKYDQRIKPEEVKNFLDEANQSLEVFR